MPSKKSGGGDGRRKLTTRVKTARGRKKSSTKWLQRQLNDPYVAKAKAEGYRSRAAFKLLELDDKFQLLKPGMRVLDLGAAPGGWTQVALQRIGENGLVAGIDLLPIPPIPGALLLEQDFLDEDAPAKPIDALGGHKADIVLSDMAPNTIGHPPTDHLRIMALCEEAYFFATEVLAEGGSFVCKALQGGTEQQLLSEIKQRFAVVKHAKPKASRSDSAETYLVATGFRGE